MPLNQQTGWRVRVYDGTLPVPYYVEARLLDAMTVPLVPPRPEQTLIEDGGRITVHSGYVVNSEVNIFNALEVPFAFVLQSTAISMMNAFGNPLQVSPWMVGADTWTAVLPANIGTRQNSLGENVVPPVSAVASDIAALVNVYVASLAPPDDAGGNALVLGYLGCAIQIANLAEERPLVKVTGTLNHYGGIQKLSAFPIGNATTPT